MRTHVSSVGLLTAGTSLTPFIYPSHIERSSIDALPARPGIYIFRDPAGHPLYVGKSINIRARVLSHLRTPDEARMLHCTAYIEFERTAGEIGALLRESQLIKQLQPTFNQKLRRTREMCALRLDGPTPQIVFGRDSDFARTDGLYGLFASKRSALEALRTVVTEQHLCSVVCGLEQAARGRPCFAHQIGRCRGACCGHESEAEHHSRLRAALDEWRVMVWPFAGRVGIVEECDGWRQTLLVDRWCYLGAVDETAPKSGKSAVLASAKIGFDMDVYRILVKPILLGNLTLSALDGATQ